MRHHRIRLDSTPLTEAFLGAQDCVVIGTDHSAYDFAWVAGHAPLIADTRNATAGLDRGDGRIWKA